MRDGPFRRALKAAALLNHRLALALRRRRRGAHFALAGSCRRSGLCCEEPAIQVGPLTWYLSTLRRAFLLWQRRVNGFELLSADARHRLFVFRCTHFDRAARACDSYDTRPGMCRDYPRVLLGQATPQFLSGCGFRAVPLNSARLRQALARQPLSDEQRERLLRDLGITGDA
jgi:uncharacterized protein